MDSEGVAHALQPRVVHGIESVPDVDHMSPTLRLDGDRH